jgi:HSP20 family molecular chaperone IbpA
MFGKKQTCSRCGSKTSNKHCFCPFCGFSLKEKDSFFEPSFNMGFPFNTIIKQLSKHIEKEFREMDRQMPPTFDDEDIKEPKQKIQPMQGLSISISSSGGQPVIRVKNLGNQASPNAQAQNVNQPKEHIPEITEKQAEHYSKLPKEEPLTSVRRFSDKIIYEIDLPEVKKENLIITRLHNSIEIKAFTQDKAFFKLIPISLPILKSQLKEGKLIIELKPTD